MSEEDRLERLCEELEHAAREAGGMLHFADQEEWGIVARRVPDTRAKWELVDCDGQIWAAGTARQLLRERERLVGLVEDRAHEAHWCGD